MYPYTYAVMTIPFVAAWIIGYILSPGRRLAILWTSIILGIAGPISEYWHARDYWHPNYLLPIAVGNWRFGIEDYILTFAMAGTAMALFEKLTAKKGWKPLPPVSLKSLFKLDMWGNSGILLMILFISILGMNSIYAIILTLLIVSAVLMTLRPEVIPLVFPIALIFGCLYWLCFALLFLPMFPGLFEKSWNLEALLGIRLAGVPVEEPLWAFCVALFVGPIYRACSTPRS
jgi:hypothetical protein